MNSDMLNSGMPTKEPLHPTDERIRQAIRVQLAKSSLSKTALAEQLGVHKSYVSQVLAGDRAKIPESLVQMLEVLGLELSAVPRQEREDDVGL